MPDSALANIGRDVLEVEAEAGAAWEARLLLLGALGSTYRRRRLLSELLNEEAIDASLR